MSVDLLLRIHYRTRPVLSSFDLPDLRAVPRQVSVESEARRDFYLYADSWWKSFTSGSSELRKRCQEILIVA